MTPEVQNKIKNIRKQLLNCNTNKIWLIGSVMSNVCYEDLCAIYEKISVLHKGLFALPYLKRQSYQDIFKTGFLLKNTSVTNYIGVVLFVMEHNAKLINKYILLRRKYENAFILGKYNLALQYLHEINTEICYSTWSAEQELKHKRMTEGFDSCSKFCEELRKAKYKLGFYSSYFLKTSSLDYPFDSDVNLFYKSLSTDSLSSDLADSIVNHTCAYLKGYRDNSWIYQHSQSSLIDLYNSVRDNLWVLAEYEPVNEKLLEYLRKWSALFGDPVVAKFVIINSGKQEYIHNSPERDNIIIDFYKRRFSEVITNGFAYLQNEPTDFAILDLYVQALYIHEVVISEINDSSSIFDRIICHYWNIVRKSQDYQLHLKRLNTISRSLYSFQCMRYIYEIINNIDSSNLSHFGGNSYMYSPYIDFADIRAFNSALERQDYISSWNPQDNSLLLLDLMSGTKQVPDMSYIINIDSSNSRQKYEIIRRQWDEGLVPVYATNTVASFLFNHLVDNSAWVDAILFYVKSKLSDPLLNISYSQNILVKKLTAEVNDDLGIPLLVSLFYAMIDFAPGKKYISYKHALKYLCVKRPSEIVISDNPEIRYFVRYVAIKKVMGLHRSQFHSYDEVVEERKLLCTRLFEATQDKTLLEEIADLAKEQQVKKLVRKVDESRIYVDEEGLMANELEEERSLFAIYKATDKNICYSESGVGILLDYLEKTGLSKEKVIVLPIDAEKNDTIVNYKDSLFRQLYLSLRDKFLLNPKYGLEFHLSTRIRHGSLINQLRMHFESHSLVTNIGNSDNYTLNTYWTDDILHLEGEERERCLELLLKFTKSVDASILKIKDEYVQIKTEEHEEKQLAAFDFTFKNLCYEIALLSQLCMSSTYLECVSQIFENLWLHTEECIKNLRVWIDQEKKNLLSELSNLNRQVIEIVNEDAQRVAPLTTAITKCSTELQRDFAIVNGWLQRRDTTAFEFSMQNVVDTCSSVINGMNVKGLQITTNNSSHSRMKGAYFNYIYDVLHNMLNNVMSYQKNSGEEVICKIEVCEIGDNMLLKVSNNVSIKDIDQVENEIKKAESNQEEYIRTGKVLHEGKTGISKIYNVVMNILSNKANYYRNVIDRTSNTITSEVNINLINIKL